MNLNQADRLLCQWAEWYHKEFRKLGHAAPGFYREMESGDWQDRELPMPKEPESLVENADRVISGLRGQPAHAILVNFYRDGDHRYNSAQIDYALQIFITNLVDIA